MVGSSYLVSLYDYTGSYTAGNSVFIFLYWLFWHLMVEEFSIYTTRVDWMGFNMFASLYHGSSLCSCTSNACIAFLDLLAYATCDGYRSNLVGIIEDCPDGW